MESLLVEYPKVGVALRNFARGLAATFEVYLHALVDSGVIALSDDDTPVVARNLAVISLFSERFDDLVEVSQSADDSALRIAASVLNALKPYVAAGATPQMDELAAHYTA